MHMIHTPVVEIRVRNWSAIFLKIGHFVGYIDCCPIENVQQIWLTEMDFGQPNVEISRKMANGQLLFLALIHYS